MKKYGGRIMNKFTLLTKDQVFGKENLEIIKKNGTKAKISDFAIISGGLISNKQYINTENQELKDRTGMYWTMTDDGENLFYIVNNRGYETKVSTRLRRVGIRPVTSYSEIKPNTSAIYNLDEEIIQYGQYPQTASSKELQDQLEINYQQNQLFVTGKTYTIDTRKYNEYEKGFLKENLTEYEYQGKKYVRTQMKNSHYQNKKRILSNGEGYQDGDYVWVNVEPVKWLVDKKSDIVLSESILLAGIQLQETSSYHGDFTQTLLYQFMNRFFAQELISSEELEKGKINVLKM